MLKVTDMNAFERFLDGAMEGNLNPLDLRADWDQSAGLQTSAIKLDTGFDFSRV